MEEREIRENGVEWGRITRREGRNGGGEREEMGEERGEKWRRERSRGRGGEMGKERDEKWRKN